MTRYTVVWHALAEDELANIWLQTSDRNAVLQASNNIDQQLANNPETKGSQVSGSFS